jgi:hypothetical protein
MKISKGWSFAPVKRMVTTGLLVGMSCGFARGARAGDSRMDALYKAFLGNPAAATYATFAREVLIPERSETNREVTLPDGKKLTLNFNSRDYFAFVKSGDRFLAAYSAKPGLTNLSALGQADRLAGYDGQEHWVMELGAAIQLQNTALTNVPGAVTSYHRLTVIPGGGNRGPGNGGVALQDIFGLAIEGYSVLNLGCGFPLSAAPVPAGAGQLSLLDPLTRPFSAQLDAGTGRTPGQIQYHLPDADVNVGLDPSADCVTVDMLVQQKVVHRTRYQLSSVGTLPPEKAAALFSWHSHDDNGKVLAFLVANGTTSEAEIRAGKLVPLRKIYDLPSVGGQRVPPARKPFIFLLFALTTAGAIWLVRSVTNQNKPNPRESE